MSTKPKLRYQISVQAVEDVTHTQEKLFTPNLEDLKTFFDKKLNQYFQKVEVEVCKCPDLQSWGLAAPGISGGTTIVQCGDLKNIDPHYENNKTFSVSNMAQGVGIGNLTFVFGHAAASSRVIGGSADLIPNARIFGKRATVSASVSDGRPSFSRCRSISRRSASLSGSLNIDLADFESKENDRSDDSNMLIERYPSDEIGGYGALCACSGERRDVLHIKVQHSVSGTQFPSVVASILGDFRDTVAPSDVVALGGCFMVKGIVEGSTRIFSHPEESQSDSQCADLTETWKSQGTSLCFSTVVADLPLPTRSFNLTTESTSILTEDMCFAGKFLRDLSPETTVYDAYFSIAESIHMFQSNV